MELRKATRTDFVWPLVKAAGFWLLVAQGALIVSPTLEMSPEPLVYLATIGFGIQCIRVLVRSLMDYGVSWRIYTIVALCLAAGGGIVSRLPTVDFNGAVIAHRISERMESVKKEIGILDRLPLASGESRDPLGPAAQRIFGNETHKSLAETRRYLLSIPQRSPEYNRSRALLDVVDRRLDEIDTKNGVHQDRKRPIQTISVEQTGHGLRVALRNNGKQSVRNIRYRIRYFRAANGEQIVPDTMSWITKEIAPGVTSTFELNDERLNHDVYGSFNVDRWDSVPNEGN